MLFTYYRRLCLPVILSLLLLGITGSIALADGGAPNLAYVSGAGKGISVIDVAQQAVTRTISISGDPHTVALSQDARFLYVTQPQENHLAIIAAKTGDTVCTANVQGQPGLLVVDNSSSLVYVGGTQQSGISVIDGTNCDIKRTLQTDGPAHGLALALVSASSQQNSNTGNQLWVASDNGVQIFDVNTGNQIGTVEVPGKPGYIAIPPGTTAYATSRQGGIYAIDLANHKVVPAISEGQYGPMDYDATTGEVYVPDLQHNRLLVLAPINTGFTPPKEPARTIDVGVPPVSVAITSDGQFGFVALQGGNVAMLDVPGRQVVNTIHVGGTPHFIITGLYPPALGTTPQQATVLTPLINIAAYAFVIALLVVPILLFRRYSKAQAASKEQGKQQ